MAEKRKKLSKFGKLLLDIIIVAALGVACFSGYQLYREYSERKTGRDSYKALKKIEKSSSVDEDDSFSINYEELKGINGDFKGWIRLPDSNIDYPFVQTNNNEYYLNHLFNGEVNHFGCVFIDMYNAPDFSDRNTVLYGHHMLDGTMFADVENYKQQSYYDAHKALEIYTEAQNYYVYPVAGYLTDGQDAYVRTEFADDTDFMNYVNGFVTQSTFQSEETIEASDRMVMLSTCSYDVSDGRFVLIGKLVERNGEND